MSGPYRRTRMYKKGNGSDNKLKIPMELVNPRDKKIFSKLLEVSDKLGRCLNPVIKPTVEKGSIIRAVCMRSSELVKKLLEDAKDKKKREHAEDEYDNELNHCLAVAVAMKNLEIIDLLLSNGASYQGDGEMYPVTLSVIAMQDVDMVDLFLRHGARFSDKCRLGSALHVACRCGSVDIVKRLYSLGDLSLEDKETINDYTPLQVAVQHGHRDVVQWLLEQGADPNVKDGEKSLWNSLHHAALQGDQEVTRLLLASGADRYSLDKNGQTPIMLAAALLHSQVTDVLAEGTDLNKRFKDGETLMHKCCQSGNILCLEYLLSKGADPSLLCLKGFTPLMKALINEHLQCSQILATHPSIAGSVNALVEYNDGRVHSALSLTFSHFANFFELKNLTMGLVQNGANLNQMLSDSRCKSWTPLMRMCYESDPEMVELFLENGADPNIVTKTGRTALSELTAHNGADDKKCLDLLLKHNLDIRLGTIPRENSRDCYLLWSFKHKDFTMVRRMVEAGCPTTCLLPWILSHASKFKERNDEHTEYEELIRYILYSMSQAPTLQEQSRLVVLSQLPHRKLHEAVDSLHLPSTVKDFLNLKLYMRYKQHEMKEMFDVDLGNLPLFSRS